MSDELLGPVVVDLRGPSLTAGEKRLLSHPMVGGLILFARNFRDRPQLVALVEEIRAVRSDLVIAVDQEGGRVQRFRDGFTRLPPMQRLGSFCELDREAGLALTRDCGWLMAVELLACGLDISFAPVLDIDDTHSQVIGDRAFSARPEGVIAAAGAFIAGMHEAGMAATGKHFPGHGSVVADSHLELPVDARALEEIIAWDLRPFRELCGQLDAIMPAHILFPQVDDQPVGFSPRWLRGILRGELNYDGVIFSDDLSMAGAASAGDFTERAEHALQAGCDSVLVCNNSMEAEGVVRHLERKSYPLSPRLARMRSRCKPADAQAWVTSDRAEVTRKKLADWGN